MKFLRKRAIKRQLSAAPSCRANRHEKTTVRGHRGSRYYRNGGGIAAAPSVGIWQAWRSPASLRVSPCRYQRRVVATKLTTSNANLILCSLYHL